MPGDHTLSNQSCAAMEQQWFEVEVESIALENMDDNDVSYRGPLTEHFQQPVR